ncbi:MAG: 5-(carboxyamino)imidazole ribonucleotide synthase [Acidobacteria bacterium]|nr:5-(carboxyamino)imidazole ribonucleotide synthase [Acidobacteriota bacterium]
MNGPILPGATIGVLGSGQLGRMLALEARRMGYRVHTFAPDHDSPTGQVADLEVSAEYDDLDAVEAFAAAVDVVTFEFENVAAEATAAAARHAPVRPDGSVLHTTQNRVREKRFLAAGGFPVAPWVEVRSCEDLVAGIEELGCPAVLKTAGWGYDGKGQVRIGSPGDAEGAWTSLDTDEAVLESFIEFEQEVSVVIARGLDGAMAHFGVLGNHHVRHILDVTIAPAKVSRKTASAAIELAEHIAEQIDLVGVLCVEMFVNAEGELLVNELAPRPHNSGHLTIDACITSQFEQQLRAVCGLPLGSTFQLRPAAMANLLGDLWAQGEPGWASALRTPEVKLHLYGKAEPRTGRKMGHLTALGATVEAAEESVREARRALRLKIETGTFPAVKG